MEILAIVASIVASIVSGAALFYLKRFFSNKDTKDRERDEIKQKENMLILKSINSVGKLTIANTIAVTEGKTNGEMHDALDTYEKVEKELFEYLLEINSKK